jgi:23S rRNA-/tRNA-specific pseudouridylate synthase
MMRLPRKARSRMGKPDRVSAYEDRRWPRFSRELSVLYEDDAVVVLDKPAGLLAVPIKGSDTPSALSLLVAKLKLKRQRALVVHRIDRLPPELCCLRRAVRIEMRWCDRFSTIHP